VVDLGRGELTADAGSSQHQHGGSRRKAGDLEIDAAMQVAAFIAPSHNGADRLALPILVRNVLDCTRASLEAVLPQLLEGASERESASVTSLAELMEAAAPQPSEQPAPQPAEPSAQATPAQNPAQASTPALTGPPEPRPQSADAGLAPQPPESAPVRLELEQLSEPSTPPRPWRRHSSRLTSGRDSEFEARSPPRSVAGSAGSSRRPSVEVAEVLCSPFPEADGSNARPRSQMLPHSCN
jgi:hypothetical protein